MKTDNHKASSVLTQPTLCVKHYINSQFLYRWAQLFSDILEVISRKKSETVGELHTSNYWIFAKISNKLNELKPND